MMNNKPELWISNFPYPESGINKYGRGQVAVLGGPEMTGAACLTAESAARIGAGLVMIISPDFDFDIKDHNKSPLPIYKNFRPHIMVKSGLGFIDYLRQNALKGVSVAALGPGLGLSDPAKNRSLVLAALKMGVPIVIDADALNAFENNPRELFSALHENAVLTPHEGEFVRLFPDLKEKLKQDRQAAAEAAIERLNGTLVLKGSNTIILKKNKEPIVNKTDSPFLATAGAGDVLAGIIAGLLAQGMEPSEAACAGVWIHGRAAQIFGAGLVASDLPELIPDVLQEVLGFREKVG